MLTAWKVSKYGVFCGPYFSVFRPEKTPYLSTFHAVALFPVRILIDIIVLSLPMKIFLIILVFHFPRFFSSPDYHHHIVDIDFDLLLFMTKIVPLSESYHVFMNPSFPSCFLAFMYISLSFLPVITNFFLFWRII